MRRHLFWTACGLVLIFLALNPALAADLPDPVTTPGATNPEVKEKNLAQTICIQSSRAKAYTVGIRPDRAYMNQLRAKQLAEMGETGDPRRYVEDHLIPLSLGGHPRDPRNLWPQLWDGDWGAHTKDRLELKLHRMVCAGELPLAKAQEEIAKNWIAAYKKYCPSPEDCPTYETD